MRSSSAHAIRPAASSYDWRDFIALDEDDPRELIDGHLVEVEVPTRVHEYIVATIIGLLWQWSQKHGGSAHASGYKLRISPKRGVMPDVQFYRHGNTPSDDQTHGLEHGRPDLVVEVISESSRRYDRIVKLRWYAQLKIPEYWIIDPEARTLERLVLKGGTYTLADGMVDDDVLRPKTFRGLVVPLSQLWKPTTRKRRRR
jgi:Uma2 family endonuclease